MHHMLSAPMPPLALLATLSLGSLCVAGQEDGLRLRHDAADRCDGNACQELLPHDLHKLFVLVVAAMLLLWALKVFYQLFRVADLNIRLSRAHSLQLEGMSIYASDFQVLVRQHFNQILRIRRTVPPKPVPRLPLTIHLHPDSIGIAHPGSDSTAPEADTPDHSAPGSFGVQFSADVSVPCSVKLFWGVSATACDEFVQRHQQKDTPGRRSGRGGRGLGRGLSLPGGDSGAGGVAAAASEGGSRRCWPRAAPVPQDSTRSLLEMEEMTESSGQVAGVSGTEGQGAFLAGQFASRDFFLPAGVGQRYSTPVGDQLQASQLQFDMSAAWLRAGRTGADTAAIIPLAIAIVAQQRPADGRTQSSSAYDTQGQLSIVKFRMDMQGLPRSAEVVRQISFGGGSVYEIHGIYGFEDAGEWECMICYTRPKNVLLLPCRHCTVCHPCLRSLRDEKCPLCRSVFSSYVTLPVNRTPSGNSEGSSSANVATAAASLQAQAHAAGPGERPSHSLPATGGTALVGAEEEEEAQRKADAGTTSDESTGSHPSPPLSTSGDAGRRKEAAQGGGASLRQGAAAGIASADARQAREVQVRRPRGVAPAARTTGQGVRMSGRARSTDAAESADAPLLQDPAATPLVRSSSGAPLARSESPAAGSAQDPTGNEETSGLISDSGTDAV